MCSYSKLSEWIEGLAMLGGFVRSAEFQICAILSHPKPILCCASPKRKILRFGRHCTPVPPVVDESQKSQFEKRKRNLKTIFPISRGKREIWIPFPQFWEEKEKFENNFSNFERRKRKLNSLSPVSREEREIRQNILNFWEEKEKF